MFQSVLIAVFPVLVLVAALKDVTTFTIPNWISGVLVLAFFPAALALGLPLKEIGLHAAIGGGALVAGVAMFAAGWIGGGDAKLFAASALWLGVQALAPYLLVTALSGGVLAVFLLNLRKDWVRSVLPTGPGWVERLREPKASAPYGVAIAAGALAAFPGCALMALLKG